MRTIILWGLFAVIIAFVGFAMVVHLRDQPADQSQARRVVGALWAAGLAVAAWVMAFFTTPPPATP